jgi:hypothetical protein
MCRATVLLGGEGMRKSAYMKSIEQAMELPNTIPELARYFSDRHSPREAMVNYIMERARADDKLFLGELVELHNYAKKVQGSHEEQTVEYDRVR